MKTPVLCADEVQSFTSKWDIGSSGAHTKVSGVPGTGFSGVARTAAGKYTITFSAGMPVGGLLSLKVEHWPAADAEPLVAGPTKSGYTAETAAAAATALYESWVIDETAAQTDFASGDQVVITATFLKTKGT